MLHSYGSLEEKWTNASFMLVGRTADPLWALPCEVANSLSWVSDQRHGQVELDCKATGLRSFHGAENVMSDQLCLTALGKNSPNLSHSWLLAPEASIIRYNVTPLKHINKHKMKLKHVAFMHPSPHIGETPRLHHFPFKCLQKLEPYSSNIGHFLKCSEFGKDFNGRD